MNYFYRNIALLCVCLLAWMSSTYISAEEHRYRRISLYNILIKNVNQDFADEIEQQFLQIPIPEQYNDHNLSVRVVNSIDKKLENNNAIEIFLTKNNVASRMVARWFNRNILDGSCDMNLIKSRGLYDASGFDRELAARSVRGQTLLEDAGEDLIGNTYVCLHEITYIDKNKRARIWGSIAQGLLTIAAAYSGNSDLSKTGSQLNDIISSLKGFSVKIHSRLYRLVWDDELSTLFYSKFYSEIPDSAKMQAFEENRSKFRLEFVGDVKSKGGTTSFLGINEDKPYLMIRKACQRAIDDNLSDLQKKYEQFRIKSPIISVTPKITADIGMKDGVTKDSRYEVLEMRTDGSGKTQYKRVGVVRPVPSLIWDNRYMSEEEGAPNADLGVTTFITESGSEFLPGMLLREITN